VALRRGTPFTGLLPSTQAVEKYLKALVLSVLDPDGLTETVLNNSKLWTHDLNDLAEMCAGRFPFYVQPDILARLKRFSEFDQAARYPWAEQKLGKGFISSDVPLLCDLVRHLRTDIPIKVDDYILVHSRHPSEGAPSRQA
jgi:HEPN domain-containing protein